MPHDPETHWMRYASCLGMPTELFFALDVDSRPDRSENANRGASGGQYEESARVCATCIVTEECLAFAMHHEPHGRALRYGMYGGMTPRQRYQLATATEP